MITEVNRVVTSGKARGDNSWEEARGVSGVLRLFHFLIWGGIYKMCSLCDNSLNR